jgi:hypothetical protein
VREQGSADAVWFEVGAAERRLARVQRLVEQAKSGRFDAKLGDKILSLLATAFEHMLKARQMLDEDTTGSN